METDLERYAWLVAYELREARSAATPEERRDHEGLARAYTMKMHALENEPSALLLNGSRIVRHSEPPPDEDASAQNPADRSDIDAGDATSVRG